jgi:thiamine-monophosphate kinase
MKIKEIGEFGFINRIKQDTVVKPQNILRPIGDDSAVYSIDNGKVNLITTDMLIENVHFLMNRITPEDLGYKAIAVNLSDIAAMGARPEHAFISLGIPGDIPVDYLDSFYAGMKEIAKKYELNIIGGDTALSKSGFIINIAITGTAFPDKILYRNTALPGDKIFVTGCVGDSKAGLHILNNNDPSNIEYPELIYAHNRPYPYVDEGLFLSKSNGVHAAIDVSDGLVSDLGHIADESSTGYVLYADSIPVSETLKKFCAHLSFDVIEFAVTGGEDYVLVFTADHKYASEIVKSYQDNFEKYLYEIGVITSSSERILENKHGSRQLLNNKGWDHFKSTDL